ncbi:MAG: hypothetical protein ABIA63_14880 [bacterium]
MRYGFLKIFCILIPLFSFSAHSKDKDSIIFLYLDFKDSLICLDSFIVVEGCLKNKKHEISATSDGFYCRVFSKEGNELYNGEFPDPFVQIRDYPAADESNILKGSIKILKQGKLVIRVPYYKDIGDIEFIKIKTMKQGLYKQTGSSECIENLGKIKIKL